MASSAEPVIRRLYESLDFRCWGTEPRGVCFAGRFAGRFTDEHHLVLPLDAHLPRASDVSAC